MHPSACHMNFGARNLKFDSSWGFRIFSLSYAPDKTKKKHLSLFLKFCKTEISSDFLNSKRLFQMDAPWETKLKLKIRKLNMLMARQTRS